MMDKMDDPNCPLCRAPIDEKYREAIYEVDKVKVPLDVRSNNSQKSKFQEAVVNCLKPRDLISDCASVSAQHGIYQGYNYQKQDSNYQKSMRGPEKQPDVKKQV